MEAQEALRPDTTRGSAREVFTTFLRLGLTSFGGPIAHLGYFRRELVEKRKWVGEDEYAQLLALTQFLPGPASSQLGFALGLLRAGWKGAIAAFTAFTLPSAIALIAFALLVPQTLGGGAGAAAIHGLKLVALAVVAHGVVGMARKLCPDIQRAAIAVAASAALLLTASAWVQLLVVALGGLAGLALCRDATPPASSGLRPPYGKATGWCLLSIFAILLVALPWVGSERGGLADAASSFYRAGALVFGGGHVVLPLLEEAVVGPGWITSDDFLAGYGAAQAVPGPMFSFAAYLGALLPGDAGGVGGAVVAVLAIFLPGFLLVAGVLPLWQALFTRPAAARIVAGVNASVVGLLAAALYDPVWISAVRNPIDIAIAAVGFALLASGRVTAIVVVLWCVGASVAASLIPLC
jgi:chromate transporter